MSINKSANTRIKTDIKNAIDTDQEIEIVVEGIMDALYNPARQQEYATQTKLKTEIESVLKEVEDDDVYTLNMNELDFDINTNFMDQDLSSALKKHGLN